MEWRALAAVGEHISLTKQTFTCIVEKKETCKVVIYVSCLCNLVLYVCSPFLFLLIVLYHPFEHEIIEMECLFYGLNSCWKLFEMKNKSLLPFQRSTRVGI